MSQNLADELRKRKAELQTPPSAPPKPKKTRKPKAEVSDSVQEIAAAIGIPATVLLSPNVNHSAIYSPSALDQQLREKYKIPICVGEKLDKFGVTDLDELAFLKRYARNRKDFQIYYQLLLRGNMQ